MNRRHRALGALTALALAWAWAPAGAAEPAATGDPVVLVHGWHGAGADDALAGSSLATWGRWLAADGYDVRWASAVAVDPAETMYDGADQLARHVSAAALDHPGRPVRIVAHSYGGVVARAFLETDRYGRLQADGMRVSELIALGAPMRGIDIWLPLLFVLGDPFNEPSVWELMPAAMAAFNAAHTQPDGTRYTVVAGDARAQVPPLWLLPPSDGAVTVSSAHGLVGRAPALVELRTDNVHSTTAYTRLLRWRSLLDDAATYRRAFDRTTATRQASDRPAAAPEGVGAVAGSLAHTPVQIAELRPGESRSLALAAPGALGFLVAMTDGVHTVAAAAAADAAPAAPAAMAAAPSRILGRSTMVLPTGPAAGPLRVHNAGTAPARVAWLGLVAPSRGVGVTTQVAGDRVVVAMSGPDAFRATGVTVTGRDGPRAVERLTGRADRAVATARHRGPGDLLYIQVTGTLDGQGLQAETTLQLPPRGPATE